LNDRYSADSASKYTKADVKALIEEAYDIAEKTGDAQIFYTSHNAVVDARQEAIAWLRKANSDKSYKDYTAGSSSTGEFYSSSTTAYTALNKAVEQLTDEYNAMQYSFQDVYNELSDVYGMIDDGELEATDALIEALDNTAYYLSTVDSTIYTSQYGWSAYAYEYADDSAFTVDREFQGFNRVITTSDATEIKTLGSYPYVKCDSSANGGPNVSHYNLWQAFESLKTEVEKQTNPTTLLGDVNGDGKVDIYDARDLLIKVVAGETVEASVGDFNSDGVVDINDAAAILKYVVANG
jgi:hypothetical protein